MERVLGILGSAMLLSLLSILFLIVETGETGPEPVPLNVTEEAAFDELSDRKKLQRIIEETQPSDAALQKRALAYDDKRFCERIRSDTQRSECISEVTAQPTKPDISRSDPQLQEENQAMLTRALAYDDTSYCENITNEDVRSMCFEELRG